MDPKYLEYVLVHEMVHLWEHGHGAGFQARMTDALPNWKEVARAQHMHDFRSAASAGLSYSQRACSASTPSVATCAAMTSCNQAANPGSMLS